MKFKSAAFILILAAGASAPAYARNDMLTFPIAPVLALPEAQAQLGDFKFSFGGKPHGKVIATTTSRRAANGFHKKPEAACDRALLNALIALKNDAIAKGGTSVQGLVSMATGSLFDSATEFQCISGNTNARVYMSGTIVK
jgi:hypothetical protein